MNEIAIYIIGSIGVVLTLAFAIPVLVAAIMLFVFEIRMSAILIQKFQARLCSKMIKIKTEEAIQALRQKITVFEKINEQMLVANRLAGNTHKTSFRIPIKHFKAPGYRDGVFQQIIFDNVCVDIAKDYTIDYKYLGSDEAALEILL